MNKNVLLFSMPQYGIKQYCQFIKKNVNITLADLFSASSYMPLGIMSIQAYIRKMVKEANVSVVSLDGLIQTKMMLNGIMNELEEISRCEEEYFVRILTEQLKFEPSIIGVSMMFDISVGSALKVVNELRKKYPKSIIILGGHPATSRYKEILLQSGDIIDAISYGEGERPFAELVGSNNYKEYLKNSKSFITRSDCLLERKCFVNDCIEDLDDIPIIDYDSIIGCAERIIGRKVSKELEFYPDLDRISLMTSRGCPYKCIFCASHKVHGRKMRYYSLNRIKTEIALLADKYKIKKISIKDDHFLFDEERAIAICDYAKSKGISLHFPNGFAMSFITQKFVDCLVRNKINSVALALESGSEHVLRDIIHKPLTLERATKVFEMFEKSDIFVLVYCVIGFPNETVDDILETRDYLNSQSLDWVGFSGATPVSGSEFEEQLIAEGIYPELEEQMFYYTKYLNPEVYEYFEGNVKLALELDVNYVNNGSMRRKKYSRAEKYFKSRIADDPNHAFAYYYRGKCLEYLNKDSTEMMQRFYQIVESNEIWMKYATYYRLI